MSDRAVANEILNDRYFGLRVAVRRCKVSLPDSGVVLVRKSTGKTLPPGRAFELEMLELFRSGGGARRTIHVPRGRGRRTSLQRVKVSVC